MSDFLNQLRMEAQACHLNGMRVVLGVSGGPDSVAMLRGLAHLRHDLELRLSVGHLNHMLRGDQSRQDVDWLAALCTDVNVPFIVGTEDVVQVANSKRQGIEETAREIRYAFLEKTANQQGCSHIVVAHTADDQVETILHHIIRGTGLSGLRGMHRIRQLRSSIALARPLLTITRHQIKAYLAELNQDALLDITNADESFTRNRIRGTLLPILVDEFNPQVGNALLRLGRQAGEIQDTLNNLANELLQDAIEDKAENICRINCKILTDQPRHLIRECMTQLWIELNWPRQRMGFDDWNRLADLILEGGMCMFPESVEVQRRGSLLVLRRL